MRMIVVAGLAALMSVGPTSHASEKASAQALFQRYQQLAHAYDPTLADLYCDTAVVRNTRVYPDGNTRTLELPAPRYKELVRASMPVAEQRGDRSTFSDVKFLPEGDAVRITASRYSVLKDYTSPVSLKMGACEDRDWGILEEITESRP
jgi:hypothetical protein